MKQAYKTKRPAFTLIELLVVIAIIAILSTLAIIALSDSRIKARDSKRSSDLHAIITAIELYKDNTQAYPPGLTETYVELCAPAADNCSGLLNLTTELSPYLSRIPQDPLATGNGTGYALAVNAAGEVYGSSLYSEQKFISLNTPAVPVTSQLALQFDADSQSSFTFASGAIVSAWTDRVAGISATQGTGTQRPTRLINELNGRAVVRFDGNDQLLLSSSAPGIFRNLGGGTIIVVAKDSNPSGGSDQHFVFFTSSGSSATTTRFTIHSRGDSGDFAAGGRRLDDTDSNTRSSLTPNNDSWNILTGRAAWSGNEIRLFVNGVGQTPNTFSSGAGLTSNTNSAGSAIGGNTSTTRYFPGDIAEIIVYQKALSDLERSLVEKYLSHKWGIEL